MKQTQCVCMCSIHNSEAKLQAAGRSQQLTAGSCSPLVPTSKVGTRLVGNKRIHTGGMGESFWWRQQHAHGYPTFQISQRAHQSLLLLLSTCMHSLTHSLTHSLYHYITTCLSVVCLSFNYKQSCLLI